MKQAPLIEFGETYSNSEVKIFDNPEFGTIRTAGTSENPVFCLVDLCKVLALDSSQVMKRLDDGVVTIHLMQDNLGRTQRANFVNEDGLYDVILDSRKPKAKAFRKWVTSEVLPTIRKTGSYASSRFTLPQTYAEALRELADKAEQNERLMLENKQQQEKINLDAPKVNYFEAFMNAAHGSKSVGIREVVKQAHIKSEKKFITWMLDRRILFRQKRDNRLQPYAEFAKCFDTIDVHDNANDWSGKQLLMNPYGKLKIVKRYHEEQPLEFDSPRDMFANTSALAVQ